MKTDMFIYTKNSISAYFSNIMKRITFTMLLLTVLFAAKAQYFPIDTARLNNAYIALINGERTAENEMEFLEAYPTTWLEF